MLLWSDEVDTKKKTLDKARTADCYRYQRDVLGTQLQSQGYVEFYCLTHIHQPTLRRKMPKQGPVRIANRADPVDDVLIENPFRANANMTCQCQYDVPMPIRGYALIE